MLVQRVFDISLCAATPPTQVRTSSACYHNYYREWGSVMDIVRFTARWFQMSLIWSSSEAVLEAMSPQLKLPSSESRYRSITATVFDAVRKNLFSDRVRRENGYFRRNMSERWMYSVESTPEQLIFLPYGKGRLQKTRHWMYVAEVYFYLYYVEGLNFLINWRASCVNFP